MTHNWKPIEGECGRYRCSNCPATGYRRSDGVIVEYRQPPTFARKWSARPSYTDSDGRVPARISEDYERWDRESDS